MRTATALGWEGTHTGSLFALASAPGRILSELSLVKIFGASFLPPTSNVSPASRVLGGEEQVGIQPP